MLAVCVALSPVTGLVERVILPITASLAPYIVVTFRNNNFFVHGQRDGDIGSGDSFDGFMELGAPFAVTGAVVIGTVDERGQFFLVLNGEDVLTHLVSLTLLLLGDLLM